MSPTTVKISPIPDFPYSASPVLYILRQVEQNKAIKAAAPVENLQKPTNLLNNSAVQFDRDFNYFNATALSSALRHDTVNGQNIKYQPIADLSNINSKYNPNNLIQLQSTLQSYFESFAYNIDKYTVFAANPTEDYTAVETSAEFELVLSFADMTNSEKVQVQFLVMDTAFNDTMYT